MQVIDMGLYLYVTLEKGETTRLKMALEWLKLTKAPGYVTNTLIPLLDEIIHES